MPTNVRDADFDFRATLRAALQHVRIEPAKGLGPDHYVCASATSQGTTYHLQVTFDGARICSCPGFKHYQSCKHLAALSAYLAERQERLERL